MKTGITGTAMPGLTKCSGTITEWSQTNSRNDATS